MRDRQSLIRLAGHRRSASARAISGMFDYGVFVVGMAGLVWGGWNVVEFLLRR